MTDLVERLRHAHEHSQQRIAGSDIFKAAADEITKLSAERDATVCCDGCGSMLTDAQIIEMRKSDPNIISCCPERKPLTIQQWRKRAHDFEAAARDMRERAAHAGYVTCAETRHVTLGNAVSAAIAALPVVVIATDRSPTETK